MMTIEELRKVATDNRYLIFENNEMVLFVGGTDVDDSNKIVLNKKDHSVVECNVAFSSCLDRNMFNAVREYVKSIESDEQDEEVEEKGEQMTYKELKKIAKKNEYRISRHKAGFCTVLNRESLGGGNTITISEDTQNRLWIETPSCVDDKDMDMMEAAMAYVKTPTDDRGAPTIYNVPLPHLVTTDGEQQYLTKRGSHWFASRRQKHLKQTWREGSLHEIPEEYRKYVKEVEE